MFNYIFSYSLIILVRWSVIIKIENIHDYEDTNYLAVSKYSNIAVNKVILNEDWKEKTEVCDKTALHNGFN